MRPGSGTGAGELLQPLPGCVSLFLFYAGVRFAHPRLISFRPAGVEYVNAFMKRDSHFFYEACRCQAPSVVTTLPSVYLRAWWLAFLVRAVICPERTSIRADRQRSNTLSCIRSVANVVRVFSGRPHLISGSNRGKPQVQPGSPHLGSMFYSCCVSLGRMREVQHRSGTGVLNKPPHPTSSLLPPFKGAKKPPNGTWGFLAP